MAGPQWQQFERKQQAICWFNIIQQNNNYDQIYLSFCRLHVSIRNLKQTYAIQEKSLR